MENQGEIVLYQLDKEVKLEVRLENETVWLSIDEMSQLFGRDISVIGKHIRNIFKEGELVKDSVWAKFAYTASDRQSLSSGLLQFGRYYICRLSCEIYLAVNLLVKKWCNAGL